MVKMAINHVKERNITRLFVTMEDLADVKRERGMDPHL